MGACSSSLFYACDLIGEGRGLLLVSLVLLVALVSLVSLSRYCRYHVSIVFFVCFVMRSAGLCWFYMKNCSKCVCFSLFFEYLDIK